MPELILIRMTNKTKETLEKVDILNAASTEKVAYDLLVPGDDYNDLAGTFNGGHCDKICVNAENVHANAMECLLLTTPLKPDPTMLVPALDPYQRRSNYGQVIVAAEINKECKLQIEKLLPNSILLIAILFDDF